MNTFTKTAIAMSVAAMGTVAMADPNLDMSQMKVRGQMGIEMNNVTSVGGSIVQTRPGRSSIQGEATSLGWVGMDGDFDLWQDTNNAGQGVASMADHGANFRQWSGVEVDGQLVVRAPRSADVDSVLQTFAGNEFTYDMTFKNKFITDDYN